MINELYNNNLHIKGKSTKSSLELSFPTINSWLLVVCPETNKKLKIYRISKY